MRVLGILLMAAGGASALLGARLAWVATHPPPGEGSLGHVGLTVVGLVLVFTVCPLLVGGGWIALERARAARRPHSP